MKQDYNILIVNPSPIVSKGLEMVLEQEEGFHVSGIANNRATALKLAGESEADIAIVDISTHYHGNIEIINAIKIINKIVIKNPRGVGNGTPKTNTIIKIIDP